MNKLAITLIALLLVPAPVLAADRSDGERLVESLYRKYAWEAVIGMPDPSQPLLMGEPKAVLQQFFTPELTGLILRRREEAARSGDVAPLDFVPLWSSQDPSASDLRVSAGPKLNTVAVSFQPLGAEARTEILFVLEETPVGIRIADMEYSGGYSLSSLLKSDQ
jgi:hypothetical protein